MYLCLWGMDTFNGTAEDSHMLYSTIFINSVAFEWNSGAHTQSLLHSNTSWMLNRSEVEQGTQIPILVFGLDTQRQVDRW